MCFYPPWLAGDRVGIMRGGLVNSWAIKAWNVYGTKTAQVFGVHLSGLRCKFLSGSGRGRVEELIT